MQKDFDFKGSESSVRIILKRLWYRLRKTNNNKRILMKKHDVAYKQCVYLKKIGQYREENRPIVYSDESYMDSSHVNSKGWSEDSNHRRAHRWYRGCHGTPISHKHFENLTRRFKKLLFLLEALWLIYLFTLVCCRFHELSFKSNIF